jgi:hypothetical protein
MQNGETVNTGTKIPLSNVLRQSSLKQNTQAVPVKTKRTLENGKKNSILSSSFSYLPSPSISPSLKRKRKSNTGNI